MELRELFARLSPPASPSDASISQNTAGKAAEEEKGMVKRDDDIENGKSNGGGSLKVEIPIPADVTHDQGADIFRNSPRSPSNAINTPHRKRGMALFSLKRRGSEDGEMDKGALPYGEIPLPRREIVRDFVENTSLGIILDICQVSLSALACVLYVIGTYEDDFVEGIAFAPDAELAMGTFFLMHFLLNWYISENRCWYLFSMEAILDIVTVLPVYISLFVDGVDVISVGVLRSVKVLRVFRILHAYRLVRMTSKGIWFEALTLLFSILAIMFCAAGLLHAAEYDEQEMTFHESFYLVFVTLTTIGYGDMYPKTAVGQYLIVLIVTVALLVIPRQLTRLQTMRWSKKKSSLVFEPPSTQKHVIVTGPRGCVTHSSLRGFLGEFFHPSHGLQRMSVCILSPAEPTKKVKSLLASRSEYRSHVMLIVGSPYSQDDLGRAKIQSASCVFILPGDLSPDEAINRQTDVDMMLAAVSVRSENASIHIFAGTMLPENETLIRRISGASGDAPVPSVENVTISMLSCNRFCPGAATLLSNLVRAHHLSPHLAEASQKLSRYNSLRDTSAAKSTWVEEYTHGLAYGIYPIDVSKPIFARVLVCDAIHTIFESFGAILFALRSRSSSFQGFRTQLVSPQIMDRTLQDYNLGFVIANSAVSAHAITRYFEQAVVTLGASGNADESVDGSSLRGATTAILKQTMKRRKSKSVNNMLNIVNLRKGVALMASSGTTLRDTRSTLRPRIFTSADRSTASASDADSQALPPAAEGSPATPLGTPLRGGVAESGGVDFQPVEVSDLDNHVVVCGFSEGADRASSRVLFDLVSAIHDQDATCLVVYLGPSKPFASSEASSYDGRRSRKRRRGGRSSIVTGTPQWGMFAYIEGSPLRVTDLNRAACKRAQNVICLAGTEQAFDRDESIVSAEEIMNHEKSGDAITGDHSAVFTAHILSTYFPDVPFCVQLYHTRSIRLLDLAVAKDGKRAPTAAPEQKSNPVSRYEYGGKRKLRSRKGADDFVVDPSYASGRAFIPVVFEALLVQSYYNPFINTLLKLLVSPVSRVRRSSFHDEGNEMRAASSLRSMRVPDALKGALAGDVFAQMLSSGFVMLALYRSSQVHGTALPYVFTCPPPSTIVHGDDVLIVLSP